MTEGKGEWLPEMIGDSHANNIKWFFLLEWGALTSDTTLAREMVFRRGPLLPLLKTFEHQPLSSRP